MRQRRWIDLFSDYDCEIRYHPGKANVVADALSRKERVKPKRVRAMNMTLQSSIKDRILAAQKEVVDEFTGLQKGLDEMIKQKSDGTLYYLDQIWVPLKGDVMAEHQRPFGLLQQPEIPEWKWEGIAMDFVTKLPRTSNYKMDRLARLYLNEIVATHGVSISIISDRNSHFTSRFWQSMQEAEVKEGQLIGPELVQETTEKISQIKARLRCAWSQRSFVIRGGVALELLGHVAYRFDLPEELSGVHDTFHVSNLKKCLADPTMQLPLDEIRVDAKFYFVEEPMEILEREFKKLKHSRIAIVKVRWNSKRGPEFTWEREDQMKLKYPHLFSNVSS
ncbi:putative reverse transcriptase domain-containing protein [Tanacetum coccineum]